MSWIWVLDALLLMLGVLALRAAWGCVTQSRLIRSLKKSSIAGAAEGPSLVEGTLVPWEEGIETPEGGMPCAYWRAQLDGRRASRARQRGGLDHLGEAASEASLLRLRDASGECLVAVSEAELQVPDKTYIIPPARFMAEQSRWQAIFPRIEALDLRMFTDGFRVVEQSIPPDTPVFVIGSMQDLPADASRKHPSGRLLRRGTADLCELVISIVPPNQLGNRLFLKSLLYAVVGLASLVTSLALALGMLVM